MRPMLRPSMEMNPSMSAWSRKRARTPAQVPEFLFAHGPDEHDIADRLDVSAVERLNEREESREPSRVIADARSERRPVTLFDGHIRAFREHGVKMGGDDELGLAGGAFADSNNVALLVEGCISEPDLA